jgi:hypothetical protein
MFSSLVASMLRYSSAVAMQKADAWCALLQKPAKESGMM